MTQYAVRVTRPAPECVGGIEEVISPCSSIYEAAIRVLLEEAEGHDAHMMEDADGWTPCPAGLPWRVLRQFEIMHSESIYPSEPYSDYFMRLLDLAREADNGTETLS